MYKHTAKFNYAEALAKSMLFYEAQRSGSLPIDQRVTWRGDSALNDGQDNYVDLSGGYYDGGAYVKYGYSQAFSMTILAWGAIRYERTYEAAGQMDYLLKTIKWGTDYFLKCHTKENEFYGQVSDKTNQMKHWGTPEEMDYLRKSYKINVDNPGSDLAGETAAALAAASIVFYHRNREYSDELIKNAISLYDFASLYKRKYHDSIKVAGAAYRSSGFVDEIAWAAAWIYRKTGDKQFLKEALKYYKSGQLKNPAEQFSWDDKRVGVQMLLAEITGNVNYKNSVIRYCSYVLPGGGAKYTPGGLLYQQEWGPLRYAANAAFICALAADSNMNATNYRAFALKQIDYMLGSTGRSYVAGFGVDPPTQIHHMSSFCPPLPEPCPHFATGLRNNKILYGALVGGPDHVDKFYNDITNQKQSSATLDFNAGFQSALAAVLDIHIWGQERIDRPKIDKPGVITKYVDTRATNDGNTDTYEKTPIREAEFKPQYDKVIELSLMFFEAQRSGQLPKTNRIPWRANSVMKDGFPLENGFYPLSRGYFDGNEYVKYGFPLAFTITMLSWSYLENYQAYESAGQAMYMKEAIKWGADYLLNAKVKDELVLIGQIGDPTLEDGMWDRPEYLNMSNRFIYTINKLNPGSDLVAETVAALAATAMVFNKNTDTNYRTKLLTTAKSLKSLATSSPGLYTQSISSAAPVYPSSGYGDEIAWMYLWLYKATGDTAELNAAKSVYNTYGIRDMEDTFSYDVKNAGVQLLLAEITEETDDIFSFCDNIVENGITTPKGLFFIDPDKPSKHAAGVALILLHTYSKFKDNPKAKSWRNFGLQQVDYLLGKEGKSFVVGYLSDFPLRPYHRASSCPAIPAPCGWTYSDTPAPNPFILYGALVGGPDKDDNYEDRRMNSYQSSVSLDSNAVFQGAVAAVYSLQLLGDLNSSPIVTPSTILLLFISFISSYYCT